MDATRSVTPPMRARASRRAATIFAFADDRDVTEGVHPVDSEDPLIHWMGVEVSTRSSANRRALRPARDGDEEMRSHARR